MRVLVSLLALALVACSSQPPPDASYGAAPQLGARSGGGLLPTVNTASVVGWDEGESPAAPDGFTVTRYAEGLVHPRWLYVLPNGDVLVAQSSTRPGTGGLMAWFKNMIQRGAGAIEDESPDQITLLRDSDGDGVVDARHVFAQNLNQPIGMALVNDHIYIANTDAVVRFRYAPNAVRVSGAPETVLELPHLDENNGHWTRTLAVAPDGSALYVAVGSVSNIPEDEDAFAVEQGRAAVWRFNPDGSGARVFATGLRNPVGMEFNPQSGVLWVAVNERDELGDNLPPDYMTSVQDGGFYGWPWYYWDARVDDRVPIAGRDAAGRPLTPDYALGAHTASLGLHFYTADRFPAAYRNGVFIGQHGSWNRSALAGYKVVFIPFANGQPNGPVQDFLTGFLDEQDRAQGRPVGVATDRTGALLVADDVGDVIWRVAFNAEAPVQ